MENGFIFAGMNSRDFSLFVEHYPAQKGPKRKQTTVSVPGRNGDLHYDDGSFENYPQPYVCGFRGDLPTPEQAHAIKQWLFSSGAYQRLEDVYDREHYRLASFAGPLDIENQLNKIGKCVITFDCKPQSYLKSGDVPQRFNVPSILYNYNFPSKPIIHVYGSGDGSLTCGTGTVQLFSVIDTVTLDCELQDAYRDHGGILENWNGKIYAPEFPVLQPGENRISWTGGVTQVEIIPRWWTL